MSCVNLQEFLLDLHCSLCVVSSLSAMGPCCLHKQVTFCGALVILGIQLVISQMKFVCSGEVTVGVQDCVM